MKVISFNTGYFLGYSGTYRDYLNRPQVAALGSKNEEDLDDFVDLVHEQKPDVILNQEIDGGSFRSRNGDQASFLKEKLSEAFDLKFGKKYRGKVFPRLPILRFMGNSLIHKNGNVENHYLDSGRKGLVQELKLENLSIYSVHLATLGKRTREKQIDQLKDIFDQNKEFVISGDFNFHGGKQEINYLEQALECHVDSPGRTFPSGNPRKKLDVVAYSSGLDLKDCRVMNETFSDHRPIIFEIDI